jgi:ribosomal protein L36
LINKKWSIKLIRKSGSIIMINRENFRYKS